MRKKLYPVIVLVLATGIYFGLRGGKSSESIANREQSNPDQAVVDAPENRSSIDDEPAYVPSAEEQSALDQLLAGELSVYVEPGRGTVNLDALDKELILDRRLTDLGNGQVERLSLIKGGGSYPYHRVEERLKYDAERETYVVAFQYMVVADHILVKLFEHVDESELDKLNKRFGTKTLKSMGFANKYIVQLPELTLDGVVEYQARFNAETQWVERVNMNGIRGVSATPNDQYYYSQWGQAKIGCPAAWDTETGDTSIIVAIIDTGVDLDHPDLAAHIWQNPGEAGALASNGVDDDNNGYVDDWIGWDFGAGDNGDGYTSANGYGHGTHCSGIAGAIGNNGIGIAGVCWNVTIMALKPFEYFSNYDGMRVYDHKAELAMRYAADNGAKVTSNSYGGEGGSAGDYLDGVAYLQNHGVLFMAAAGNGDEYGNGIDNDSIPHWPSNVNLPNVISVGSSDQSDGRSTFSNYGATSVHIFAPGSSIRSLYPGGSTRTWNGTSMACPQVAGAAALLYSQNPSLSWQDCKAALMDNVTAGTAFDGKCVSGGRMNLAWAMGFVDLGDQDGDGIPDDWEQAYYGSKTGADPSAMAANGINTVMEAYLAGISPIDPNAKFGFEDLRDDSGLGRYILEWDEADGRVYAIYWTPNLKYIDFTPLIQNYSGGAFTDLVHEANSVGFYRLEAGLAPEE